MPLIIQGTPFGISPEQFKIVEEEYICRICIKLTPDRYKTKKLIIVGSFMINNLNIALKDYIFLKFILLFYLTLDQSIYREF